MPNKAIKPRQPRGLVALVGSVFGRVSPCVRIVVAFGVLDPAAPEGGQAKRSELARTGGAAGAAAPDGVSGSRIPDRQAEGQKDLS